MKFYPDIHQRISRSEAKVICIVYKCVNAVTAKADISIMDVTKFEFDDIRTLKVFTRCEIRRMF